MVFVSLYSSVHINGGIPKPPLATLTEEVFASHSSSVRPASESVLNRSKEEVQCGVSQEEVAQAFIERYSALYRAWRGGRSAPPISTYDRELLKRRLRQDSPETLEKWLPRFFESRFGYVRRRHYSLESFLNSLYVLQASPAARQEK